MKRKPTASESLLGKKMSAIGLEHKTQVIVGFYVADIVIPSKMVLIEVDGRSHEGREAYDRRRDEFLRRCGFDVVHVKNDDTVSYDLSGIAARADAPTTAFRSALGKANAFRGAVIARQREREA